ncbi:MAG: hypothetical protein IT210_22065 [Armatimonadetes bacterium]|nr:hypothetical protein [Armatimonadota bacterium]
MLFRRVMDYQAVDRLPLVAFEPYETAGLDRWRSEGLPVGVSPQDALGMDAILGVPVDLGPLPAFERHTLWQDSTGWAEIDSMGATVYRRREAPAMYYGYIDHPVKGWEDWARYRERYRPDAAGRLPASLETLAAELNASDMPVGLHLFPFFFRTGFYLMGMERFLTAFHDMPDLLHDMFERLACVALAVIRAVLANVRLDFVTFAEDLAYRGGPHISPKTYAAFWLPYQQPIVEELRRHGVPLICLWSSGNIDALLPLLLESGFNCTWPVERAAGMDPVALRRRYGRDLRLGGGIDKAALIAWPEAIDRELGHLAPAIADGGYVPAIDDMVPPEAPWCHYRYCIEALRKIRPSFPTQETPL